MVKIKKVSLRKNFSWSFLGNVIHAACQWGILVGIAKMDSVYTVGQYTLGLAMTAPIFMFTNLQLRQIQATDAGNQYSFSHYLGLRLITSVIAFFVICTVTMVSGYREETAWIIMLIGLAKCFESISDIIYGLLQKYECMERIAVSLIIKGPVSLLSLCIMLWATGNIVAAVMALTAVWLIVLLLYDLGNARLYESLCPVFNRSTLWNLVRLSIPLGVVMMLISLNSNIPRYFIEHYLGMEALGYFSAIAYVITAGNIVVNALGQSVSPRLAKYYAGGFIKQFRSLIFKLILIGFSLGLAGLVIVVLFGREILTVIYQPDYAAYVYLFTVIMVGAGLGFISSFLGYAMTAARFFIIQPMLFALVSLISFISCFFLMPAKGLEGAAYSMVIAALVQLLGCLAINSYIVRLRQGGRKFWEIKNVEK